MLLLSEAVVAMPNPIAQSPHRQPVTGDRIEMIGQNAEIPTLERGNPIEREIAPGEAHSYQIDLEAGQYLRVTVAQLEVDIEMTLFDPAGVEVLEIQDDSIGTSDEMGIVAEVGGNYRLQVRPAEDSAAPGKYRIQLEDVRTATERDRQSFAAALTYQDGIELYEQGTAASLQQAIVQWEAILPVWRDTGNRSKETLTLNWLGFVYNILGEKQKARDYLEQALPLARSIGSPIGEASLLINLGSIYNELGDKQKALDYYQQSLPILQAIGDRRLEAITLSGIGLVYSDLGEPQQALDYYQQSLPIRREVGDRAGEATTLNNIGGVYDALGEKQNALDYYQQALILSQTASDSPQERLRQKITEATILISIGKVYADLGENQKALDSYQQALSIFQTVGDRAGETTALNNIGGVYNALGEKQQALEYYQQALTRYQSMGDRSGEASTLNNMSLVYLDLGETHKALELLQQAFLVFQGIGERRVEAAILNSLGGIYSTLGENRKALDYYQQSLPIRREIGDRAGEAIALNNIGGIYSDLGEHRTTLDYAQQALPLAQAVGDRAGEASILYNLAFAEGNLGNFQTALTHIQGAINIIEDLRTKIGSQELRASYFADNQNYYEFYIKLLMELHRQNPDAGYDSQAFHISERARARSLLELLAEANADIRQGVDPTLLDRERTLRQQLNAADFQRTQLLTRDSGYTNTELEAIKQEIDSLLDQLQTLEGQIRATSPRYAALQYPQPLTLTQIQQQLLDDDTLMLQYALGEQYSYLWAVSKTGMTSYQLPSRAEIEAAAQPFLDHLKSETGTDPEAGIPLAQILLAPVTDRLNGQRLAIVGDGILQTLPFAALPVPTGATTRNPTLLLEHHEIATLPSASSLAISRQELASRPVAPKTLAVLADPVFNCLDSRLANSPGCNPDNNSTQPENAVTRAASFLNAACTNYNRLPYTKTEAESLLALVPENQRFQALGFDASPATATSAELANYQIVHLATHGCVSKENPNLQGLVLSMFTSDGTPQDGFLRLADIFNLNLSAELVVLSACQTGIGDNLKGEGIVGLTRGFMYAGAKRVAVSLWSVNDFATAQLMGNFYQKMFGEGLSPTAALRQAQLAALQAGQPPYEWAAFVVQGEWGD
jgi:CHAT domain-containing protein/Tfp pilus assembly protein PilF